MAVQVPDEREIVIEVANGLRYPVRAGEIRRLARAELGMVSATDSASFEVDLFGRAMIARAMTREVHLANEHLRVIYSHGNGVGWMEAVSEVSSAMELCKQMGITPEPWVPETDEMVMEILRLCPPVAAAAPAVAPVEAPVPEKGVQETLDLGDASDPITEQAPLGF